jgi:L-alanine-DL-glutamate epimerase-like enolase superfamily enzyme
LYLKIELISLKSNGYSFKISIHITIRNNRMLNRRSFISAASISAATLLYQPSRLLKAMPRAENELGKVKITDVKTAAIGIKKYKTHLVKITTDSGLYGLGEAFPKSEVADDIQEIKRTIIGEDPLHVEYLHQKMTESHISRGSRNGALCGAIAGIEIALWDLAGKILNIPVYILLGGAYRDKIMIYHDSDSPKSEDPYLWAEEALKSLSYGFKAIKLSLRHISGEKWNRTLTSGDIKKWIKILEAVRLAIGADFPMAVDLHWRYNTRDALRFLGMAEDLNLWFVEDPLPPENADAFARLTAKSKIPIATGENLYTRQGFRPFIESQACDIVHPDAQKCGGLLEMKRIADWADMYYMSMLCHNGCTPVGTIASAHACKSIKTFMALESDSVEIPYWQDIILRDGPIYRDGYVELSDRPGIGVELNEEVCRQHLADERGFFE